MDSCTVADEVFDSCSSKNMLRFANGYHVACGSVSGVILSWNRVGEKLVPCMPVAKRMGSRRYVRVCFFLLCVSGHVRVRLVAFKPAFFFSLGWAKFRMFGC